MKLALVLAASLALVGCTQNKQAQIQSCRAAAFAATLVPSAKPQNEEKFYRSLEKIHSDTYDCMRAHGWELNYFAKDCVPSVDANMQSACYFRDDWGARTLRWLHNEPNPKPQPKIPTSPM
ncbi:MAG: hypothetical protein ABSA49_19055 [Rhizomicrobium sp.]|jgi:hypothetical protein